MRVGFRTLVSLALCAAAAGAAVAHFAIDVLGDYALARDSYDNLRHGSRELLAGLALLLAALLAARGLRVCCEIAAKNRARLVRPVLRLQEITAMAAAAIVAGVPTVPAMEYLDGRLDGMPVSRLSDAFGGSIPLGLATTVGSIALVALVVATFARWLISHHDTIVTIVEVLLKPFVAVSESKAYARRRILAPRRRRTTHALRLSKRGPPAASFT